MLSSSDVEAGSGTPAYFKIASNYMFPQLVRVVTDVCRLDSGVPGGVGVGWVGFSDFRRSSVPVYVRSDEGRDVGRNLFHLGM